MIRVGMYSHASPNVLCDFAEVGLAAFHGGFVAARCQQASNFDQQGVRPKTWIGQAAIPNFLRYSTGLHEPSESFY
jgi:hypothetical protein